MLVLQTYNYAHHMIHPYESFFLKRIILIFCKPAVVDERFTHFLCNLQQGNLWQCLIGK
jgi:hypothetical protein